MKRITPSIGLILLATSACSDSSTPNAARIQQAVDDLANLETSKDAAGVNLPASWGFIIPDATMAHAEAARLQRLSLLSEVEALESGTLPEAKATELAEIRQALNPAVRLDRLGIGFVTTSNAGPYLITGERGAYVELTSALANAPISTREDADLWIAAMSQVAAAIEAETERFTVEFSEGVIPPNMVIAQARSELSRWRKRPGMGNPLLLHIQLQLAQIADLPSFEATRMLDEARSAFTNDLAPALTNLDNALAEASKSAPAEPGLWKSVGNEAYYPALIEFYVRDGVSPVQLAEQAETAVEDAWLAADPILSAMGLTEGSVVDRLAQIPAALETEPAPITESDADTASVATGSATVVAARIDWARNQLAQIITQGQIQPLQVRPANPGETIAPLPLEYRAANATQSRARLIVDPNAAGAWPDWVLPAMIYAETLPGRHLFASQARNSRAATSGPYAASLDGWSLYATDLASDLGGYDALPAERLGYLRYLALQAGRVVADVGIHQERWTRQEALDYFVGQIALSPELAEAYADEIIRNPARSTLAFAGREAIWAYRDRADRELGANFQLRLFHDRILAGGPRPLIMIETEIDSWVDSARPTPRAE